MVGQVVRFDRKLKTVIRAPAIQRIIEIAQFIQAPAKKELIYSIK